MSDVASISRGKVMSKDFVRDNPGTYPVYSSQTQNNGIFGYIDSFAYDFESITWTTDGANAGSVFYHEGEKFSITNVCGLIRTTNPNQVSTKYLFYQLGYRAKSHVQAGMGNPKLMAGPVGEITFPLPELVEQERICEILDNFDALVNDISIGLPAEIKARRQQYEYYRDQLLSFKELAA
ncbi:MAG: restriction endonuclease subunit S [Aurantimicrobium sp.]|uniref:restriction endonuclease subunit S n=1 Tax=Aurantimicrobium sp. TaxID=1930784 RepID=UPI002FC5C09A